MGLNGFLLISARSVWTKLEEDLSLIRTPDSLSTMEAACPAVHPTGHVHLKMAAAAAGILFSGVAIGYYIGQRFSPRSSRVNNWIQLDKDKVVDSQDIEDVGEKRAYCRCWKSKNFPYCDGTHNQHNKETGDNTGPLIISNKKTSALP
ncbi:ZnF-CDGSH domain-containing protein [Aphelenchoides besseyi]|nr:ZnF-CDGSH domain-containing protein [Aphelenchoides besseyi]